MTSLRNLQANFSFEVKSLRFKMGLTQEEFGNSIGRSHSHISHIESGRYEPSLSDVLNISRVWHVSPLKLIWGWDDSTCEHVEMLLERGPAERNRLIKVTPILNQFLEVITERT